MKSLQKRNSTEIIEYDFEAQAGDGMEDITQHDLPRASLKLAQKLTPECEKQDDCYIEGLEPGKIFNRSTRKFWDSEEDKGVLLLPIKYLNREIEWLPDRGGFKAEHLPGSAITKKITIQEIENKKVRVTEFGTHLVDTAVYHCFMLKNDGSYDEVVIDMCSTQWECAKQFNAFTNSLYMPSKKGDGESFKMPLYSNLYRFFAKFRPHEKFTGWYVWKYKHLNQLDLAKSAQQRLYKKAIEYKQSIDCGSVEVDRSEDIA